MTASIDTAAAREPETPRVVLITGAARRIGRSLALGFAARGWDVAVHYGASRGEAEEVVAEIARMGRRAVALHAELSDEAQVAAAVTATRRLLVNASANRKTNPATRPPQRLLDK